MKALAISDIHAHNHQQFSHRLPNGRNSRLQDTLNVLEQARFIAQHQKIDILLVMGDIHHCRTHIDTDVYSATFLAFQRLASVFRKSYCLLGNHDQHSKVGDVHSLEAYRSIMTVIDQPWLECIELDGKEVRIAFHPFASDVNLLLSFYKSLPNGLDLLCQHQGISEAAVGPFDMHAKMELSINQLPFAKAKHIMSGDFHKRQFMHGGKFHYVGSPLQLSMGERMEDKGFSVIDFDTMKIDFVESQAPKFRMFENPEQFKTWAANNEGYLPRDFIRVRCSSSEELALKAACPRIQTEIVGEEKVVNQRIIAEAINSDDALLKQWLSYQKTTLDKAELHRIGMQHLKGEDAA